MLPVAGRQSAVRSHGCLEGEWHTWRRGWLGSICRDFGLVVWRSLTGRSPPAGRRLSIDACWGRPADGGPSRWLVVGRQSDPSHPVAQMTHAFSRQIPRCHAEAKPDTVPSARQVPLKRDRKRVLPTSGVEPSKPTQKNGVEVRENLLFPKPIDVPVVRSCDNHSPCCGPHRGSPGPEHGSPTLYQRRRLRTVTACDNSKGSRPSAVARSPVRRTSVSPAFRPVLLVLKDITRSRTPSPFTSANRVL